jgi:hypothetical protein
MANQSVTKIFIGLIDLPMLLEFWSSGDMMLSMAYVSLECGHTNQDSLTDHCT